MRLRPLLIVDNYPYLPPSHVMDSTSEIMTLLRAARALLDLSQDQLAERAGVSRQIVVRIEKCEGNVLVDAIGKVRSALEAGGVVFIEGNSDRGPGVAMVRPAATKSYRPDAATGA